MHPPIACIVPLLFVLGNNSMCEVKLIQTLALAWRCLLAPLPFVYAAASLDLGRSAAVPASFTSSAGGTARKLYCSTVLLYYLRRGFSNLLSSPS
jgi:hypothetical protein